MSPVKNDDLYEIDELTEIHAAIINDDLEQLKDICQDEVDLDEKFSDEIDNDHVDMTPLALAAALNRTNQVEVLLRYGANVNASFANLQTTALMTSSFHGHVDVVKCLLKYGANVQATDVQGSTALGYCFGGTKSMDVVELLLAAGIDVNVHNMLGMNALLLVSGYCNRDLVRSMLAAHALPNVANNYGHSPLHLAVFGKRSKIMKITGGGQSQLYGLNQPNIKEKFKSWIGENPDRFNNEDLSVVGTWVEEVGELMEEIGARTENFGDLSATEHDEDAIRQGLHAANKYRKDKILKKAVTSKKSAIMKTILSCGGRRGGGSQTNNASQAPMARPYQPPNADIEVEELVQNVIDETRDVVGMLVDAGCKVDAEEKAFGLTALDLAILCGDIQSTALLTHAMPQQRHHIFQLLSMRDLYDCVSAGSSRRLKDLLTSDPHVDVNSSFSVAHMQQRGEESEEEDLATDALLTPLAVAAKAPDNSTVDVIKLLIKHGGDLNGVGSGGRSALCEACRWGNVKMVEFLLNQGADMETKNRAFNEATPLAVAVMHQQHATARLLVSRGAFVDALMNDGRTSLIVAMDNEDLAMVEALLQADPQQNFASPHALPCLLATNYRQPNRDMKSILSQINREAEEIRRKEDAAARDADIYATIPDPTASVRPAESSVQQPPKRPSQPPKRPPIRPPTPNSESTESPERPSTPHRPSRNKKNSAKLTGLADGLVDAVDGLDLRLDDQPTSTKKKKKQKMDSEPDSLATTQPDDVSTKKARKVKSRVESNSSQPVEVDDQGSHIERHSVENDRDPHIQQSIAENDQGSHIEQHIVKNDLDSQNNHPVKKLNETFEIPAEESSDRPKSKTKKKKVPTATLR